MKELITINKTDYINLAIDLAKNPKKIEKIKDDLEKTLIARHCLTAVNLLKIWKIST